MSYSFSVTAASKAEAKERIAEEFDRIVVAQPSHKVDRDAAQAAVEAFVDAIIEPGDGQQISVFASGSVGWRAEGEFLSASGNFSASISAKAA